MKILIVDGFKPDHLGAQKFNDFVCRVKESFKRHKYTFAGSLEYVLCTPYKSKITKGICNIDDFLYESFAYGNSDNQKRFDSVDMVFLDGSSNLLPWTTTAKKLGQLFKMCKLTDK